MLDFNDFSIPEYSVNKLPAILCRAVICSVYVEETDSEENLGKIDIDFLLLNPSFEEPLIFEKHYVDWPIEGGVEPAFECLISDDVVGGFDNLVGAIFDAQIYFSEYEDKIRDEFQLNKLVALPLLTNTD